jgi:hypothetical protein
VIRKTFLEQELSSNIRTYQQHVNSAKRMDFHLWLQLNMASLFLQLFRAVSSDTEVRLCIVISSNASKAKHAQIFSGRISRLQNTCIHIQLPMNNINFI